MNGKNIRRTEKRNRTLRLRYLSDSNKKRNRKGIVVATYVIQKRIANGLKQNKMTKKIIQLVAAVMIGYMFYELYCIEQKVAELEKMGIECRKPE